MPDRSSESHILTINLDRSREPRAFREEDNLWENDLRRIYRLIRQQVDLLERYTTSERAPLTGR